MKFNANHGLYRKHRELNKLFARNINATFEANLIPKNECRHISYRNKAKMFRLVRIHIGVIWAKNFFNVEQKGGKR